MQSQQPGLIDRNSGHNENTFQNGAAMVLATPAMDVAKTTSIRPAAPPARAAAARHPPRASPPSPGPVSPKNRMASWAQSG